MDLDLIWEDVEAALAETGVALSEMKLVASGIRTPWGEILIGVDSWRRRHVIVPAPNDTEGRLDATSQGIRVEVRPYVQGREEAYFCDMSCRAAELNDAFSAIARDVLTKLPGSEGESPFPACVAILERWRRLLARAPSSLLSRTAQAGLVGELLVLRDLVAISVDALDSWVGPQGGRHDFVSEGADIEVKTSLAVEQMKIRVQSLDQLERPTGGSLYIQFYRLREPTGQGITLPEVIQEVLAAGVDSTKLYELLAEGGYSPADASAYIGSRFEVVSSHFYHVDEAFPRLVRSDLKVELPIGVSGISYDVDLLAAQVQSVSQARRVAILEDMARS